jgi:hypothetical protein
VRNSIDENGILERSMLVTNVVKAHNVITWPLCYVLGPRWVGEPSCYKALSVRATSISQHLSEARSNEQLQVELGLWVRHICLNGDHMLL